MCSFFRRPKGTGKKSQKEKRAWKTLRKKAVESKNSEEKGEGFWSGNEKGSLSDVTCPDGENKTGRKLLKRM